MGTKDFILKELRRRRLIRTADLARATGLSRQTVHQHLRELAEAGKLIKVGSTRASHYIPYTKTRARLIRHTLVQVFDRSLGRKGLDEDRVFQEAALRLNLAGRLSERAYGIERYAFTEMLNNAIDHSKSRRIRVKLECAFGNVLFEIRDHGIGVFESVRSKFGLRDHFEAVEHLLKGKQTVDPERHTGQGIFFTSKIADRFVLESAKVRLSLDHDREDVCLEEMRSLKGTRVKFVLKEKSRKNLKALFDEYSDADFEFDKTQIKVRLTKKEGEFYSRSEAKRLLFGLEKFRRVVFDFEGVKAAGQSFTDEIFRVFRKAHPEMDIQYVHASEPVRFMIERALRTLQ